MGVILRKLMQASSLRNDQPDPELSDRDSVVWIARNFVDGIGATYWDFARHLGKPVQMIKFILNWPSILIAKIRL